MVDDFEFLEFLICGVMEVILENNCFFVVVDWGGGFYCVFYILGCLNWEYKYFWWLVFDDLEIDLMGFICIVCCELKFMFCSCDGELMNLLFCGFDCIDEEME